MKKTNKKSETDETDSLFLYKIVLYVILGSLWLKFLDPINVGFISLSGVPIGLMLGLLISSHDKLQIDRKLEYVVLIIMTVISYFLPAGIVI